MSEVCRRGYKCMCFQCGEKDCERYEPEPPEWLEELVKDKEVEKYFKELEKQNRKHADQIGGRI